eukprot:TRINITY_DN15771_c0_g1_i2.p1 TRINITY_DN15771_c0_g1~~TRINITY_DN15771_c0_g1_i2.p1  ORF type:complete len:200 (-),score=50.71 TRINITY_DN15771_c0_g1_i2:66-665(-)
MGFISFSFSPNVTFVVQVSVRRYQSLIMCLVCLVGFEWAPHWWSRVSSFGSSGINAEYGGITTLLKDTLVSFPILPIEPQQKLDPNFFLANERVLLKWIRISLTWSSLGIFFVFSGATKLAEYVSGWGLLLLAISTAGYGIASHQLRLKAWKSKSHYSDPVGITIVLSAIFLAALFVAVLAGVYGEPIRFRRLALLTPK